MNNKEVKSGDPSESISFLNQLVRTLEEAELKLEQAYKKNNPEQVKAIKQFILKIQVRIDEVLK